MSYSTIATCVEDAAFQQRITSCIAQEQLAKGNPVAPNELVRTMVWATASASDVEAAYASALAADNPNPGGDEAVISDGMILANVQAHWPAA
jgi:hypothetical protein